MNNNQPQGKNSIKNIAGARLPRYAIIKICKNLVPAIFVIFLIVYSRIRHALRSGGYRDGFAALRLQNLLVFCPRGGARRSRRGLFCPNGEVAQRAEGGILANS